MISHDPIVTSVCVQVPRDTGSSVSVLIFSLRGLIFGLRAVLGQLMYLRGPNTEIHLSFGLAARVRLVFSRSSPSPHRTAGGPRKLVRGVASAMGNNQGVFISPSFPSLGPPTETCTKNSAELKGISGLHADPEPPRGDCHGLVGAGLG